MPVPPIESGMVVPAAAPPLACPSCQAPVAGRYCAACGERMLEARDESFLAFVGEALEALTSFDNRIWRTARGLFRPGFLTAEHLAGRRRPYVGPVQLFLVLSVVFFLLSPGMHLYSTSLAQFERDGVLGPRVQAMVASEMARLDMDHAAFSERFNRVMDAQKRVLVLLAVPFFAAVLKLLYRRRSYVAHLVFATHAIGSLLVLMVLYTLALFFSVYLVFEPLLVRTGGSVGPPPLPVVLLVVATPVVLFLYAALRRVHAEPRPLALAKTLAAVVGLFVSMLAYEHFLFVTTVLAIRLGV
jgi:hypothetical protein